VELDHFVTAFDGLEQCEMLRPVFQLVFEGAHELVDGLKRSHDLVGHALVRELDSFVLLPLLFKLKGSSLFVQQQHIELTLIKRYLLFRYREYSRVCTPFVS